MRLRVFLCCYILLGSFSWCFSQEIEQLAVFNGPLDYVAFGNTMNLQENGAGGTCEVLTSSTATLTLDAGQNVVAAYLYWAGAGPGDFEVALNGTPITASRTFADQIDDVRIFFAAFAEITELVQQTGSGTYTLSDLDVTDFINSDPVICNSGVNFAGWAITVIFEDPTLPDNQVNVFDGLESVSQNSQFLEIELENLNVVDNEGARIGFVAWEGDSGIAVAETLSINGNVISNPPLNPADNQFNGTNSFTGATDLFNMDLDVYDIENNINIGDTAATITLTSGQDFVMINNIITVLNSTLPDAIIAIDNAAPTSCLSRDVSVTYTVTNQGTEPLPVSTPIAFYADGVLVGTTATTIELPPNASESNTIVITIPDTIPEIFELIAIVDDIGDGTGVVSELNENNNESLPLEVNLNLIIIETPLQDLSVCDDSSNDGIAQFDLTVNGDLAIGNQQEVTASYFLTESDAQNTTNPIATPSNFLNSVNPQTIYIRLELDTDPDCFLIDSFLITVEFLPTIPALEDLTVCDDSSNDGLAIFDLTSQNETIIGDQEDVAISFYTTLTDAEQGVNAIANPTNYENTSNPQLIYVRLENALATSCFTISSFTLFVEDVPIIANPLEDIINCDDPSNDNLGIFDLTTNTTLAIGNQTDIILSFHLTTADAMTASNPITTPAVYQNISNPQEIFVRLVQDGDDLCFTIDSFFIELSEQPVIPIVNDIVLCDDISNDGVLIFDLSSQEDDILEGQENFVINYFTSFDDAEAGVNPIQDPQNFTNTASIQSIYIRLENPLNPSCFDIGTFAVEVLMVDAPQELSIPPMCNEGFDMAVFDLTLIAEQFTLLDGETITGYYLNPLDAFNAINAIENPASYSNTSNPQTIYIRADSPDNDICYRLAQVDLRIENCPPFVPEGFSPNGDIYNETFEISGLKNVFFDYELLIYSRLGNLIYRGDNDIPFWDGVPNEGIGGSEAPTATYFYVLKLNDPNFNDILGWVYLNR